ncbi:hypothetical protein [Lacticaseibacillus nasuensis]|uniref:hypothetical protein n=1 Tax=Lacticaseibacillus nasuensis TaxID=944671 RepID=UPI002247C706|nr:hypothetical protein [Lacticaseibacillus nasuensis]MCX2455003.1 hypothetical protein [Lacticaseibacillus nasuensis]
MHKQFFPTGTRRGMFMILPLKYDSRIPLLNFSADSLNLPIAENQPNFQSADFIQLMNHKCASDGNFVRRWVLNLPSDFIKLTNQGELVPLAFTNFQVFIFNHGIAFLTVYLEYPNSETSTVYKFFQPGYTVQAGAELRASFINQIQSEVLDHINPRLEWFTDNHHEDNDADTNIYLSDLITKDAYRMNVAYAPSRFTSPEELQQPTYNLHRMVDLNREFTDSSEHDLAYVTGAKDVDDEHYGWGCAITSQELSYVYAPNGAPLPTRANDDLLLLILVMYQKYESMSINEKIHSRYMIINEKIHSRYMSINEKIHSRYMKANERSPASIRQLKQEALQLIAYETLAPSQISRWNNVCEIYRNLLNLTGVDETITEVKDKVTLLTDEQDRSDAARDNAISMVITVFGLVSIISAILQTVDYLDSRSPVMWISFIGSLVVVLVFGIYLGMRWTHKRG